MHKKRLIIFACIFALTSLHAQQNAKITVNAGQPLGPVNRLVFGQNIDAADSAYIFSSNSTDLNLIQRGDGFWDPVKAVPVPDISAQSKAAGMTMLRYPGGCLAHNLDWRKTVGPDAKKNGWLFGLDEYLSLCSTIGATPLITMSDYVLPADQIPENAAALVEYLNSPADAAHPWALKRKQFGHAVPYNVTWFELGNESMHGNHRVLPHRQYSAEQYAAYANAVGHAMRKVDPRIKLGIVMVPGAGTDVDSVWNQTVVRLAGATADFITLHMYAPQQMGNDIPASVRMQAMMVAPQQVEEHLREYHQMIQKQLGHDLPLAITEFNGAIDQTDSIYRFSYGNALECADLLRVFLLPESNVALANYWQFLNGPFGMLHTTVATTSGRPETEEPAFLLYELWKQHFGSILVTNQVVSPRGEFPGAGTELAANGEAAETKRQLQSYDLNQYSSLVGSLWPRLLNVQIQRQNADFTIRLNHLSRDIYPTLAHIPRPDAASGPPAELSASFDAKFIPDAGSETPQLGIGLMDSRGWAQTHSGLAIEGVTTDWQQFSGTYRLTATTPAVDVTARLVPAGKNMSGTLLIRNLKLTGFISAHDAAYPLLTSIASISSNHRKIYLMVFNKSATDSIQATIHLEAFTATQAQYWEVNGPGLNSTSGVAMTQQGTSLGLNAANNVAHVFPAHSMTAIEFNRSR